MGTSDHTEGVLEHGVCRRVITLELVPVRSRHRLYYSISSGRAAGAYLVGNVPLKPESARTPIIQHGQGGRTWTKISPGRQDVMSVSGTRESTHPIQRILGVCTTSVSVRPCSPPPVQPGLERKSIEQTHLPRSQLGQQLWHLLARPTCPCSITVHQPLELGEALHRRRGGRRGRGGSHGCSCKDVSGSGCLC